MTTNAPKIIEALEQSGLTLRFVHFGMIKPLDESIIGDLCAKTKKIVTLEEHNIIAGFGVKFVE